MNELQTFDFKGIDVRTTIKDNELWWVAKDVCEALEIRNSRDAVSTLDEDEKGVAITDPPDHISQNYAIVSEPGLYKLIFRSRKERAKAFTRWVTHEVLPMIRKTGRFGEKVDFEQVKKMVEVFKGSASRAMMDQMMCAYARKIGLDVDMPPMKVEGKPQPRATLGAMLNQLQEFLTDRFPKRPVVISCKDLWEAYENWAESSGCFIDSKQLLGAMIKRLGMRPIKTHRFGRGWKLMPDDNRDDEEAVS